MGSFGSKRPRNPGFLGQGPICQNCCSTSHLLAPDIPLALCQPAFSRKEVHGHGQARAEGHSSREGLHWLPLPREELGPAFPRVNSAHALQQGLSITRGRAGRNNPRDEWLRN